MEVIKITNRERIKLTVHMVLAFKNAGRLDKIINEYNKNPIKYEQDHPDFDLEKTKRIRQEFLDVFDDAFTKLREAAVDEQH